MGVKLTDSRVQGQKQPFSELKVEKYQSKKFEIFSLKKG
jgi:hypothetical protein